jgi:hypothetical protein
VAKCLTAGQYCPCRTCNIVGGSLCVRFLALLNFLLRPTITGQRGSVLHACLLADFAVGFNLLAGLAVNPVKSSPLLVTTAYFEGHDCPDAFSIPSPPLLVPLLLGPGPPSELP